MPDGALEPTLFAPDPARDARFVVKDRWAECVNLAPDDPRRPIEFLHRQMNEEVNSIEACAKSLADFPDIPWEMRMGLARQCADEARHALMFRRIYEARGGVVGEYPVLNFQYRIICAIPTLVGRLTVQNRSFEAGGIDAIEYAIPEARNGGDAELAELFEAQLADEIGHVRFANEAIEALKKKEPRSILHMGSALAAASRAFKEVMGKEATEGARAPVASEARSEAGFRPDEIRLAGDLAQALASGRPTSGSS
jgi:uncharacterized ferritin-like protein (DUF455 family)